MKIAANNPDLKSWVEVPSQSDFPIQNLPFGIFSTSQNEPSIGVRIGDKVLDLAKLASLGYFEDLTIDTSVFSKTILNDFIATGQKSWRSTRNKVSELLQTGSALEKDADKVLIAIEAVTMHMPVQVGDYTDFYSSIEHATNLGKLFRPNGEPLFPNWRHMPVGYHGRASSIVVSGTNIHRPKGQVKADNQDAPSFGASKLLDFELEVAFITGTNTKLGDSIPVAEAENHIFGLTLFNDLSARDIQKWEYVPLGPFLGKNFGSVISAWVVTLDALEPYRLASPEQTPKVLPYLQIDGERNIDLKLEVIIQPEGGEGKTISNSNFKYMYWNMAQQLAHQTVNGCNIKVGDMYASGTISGKTTGSYGSMLEITWRGTQPIQMPDGTERKFIQDHDTLIMKGYCEKNGVRIGFGEVSTKILPTK